MLLAWLFFVPDAARAQKPAADIPLGVTYTCNGERLMVESCNIRDTSETSTCMVGHPDRVRNGLMAYTTETRGALHQLLPTCKQPSTQELAAADALHKRQQAIYDANVQKANQQMATANAPVGQYGQPQKPKTPEERETNRCVTSGRLPSSCLGNSLLGGFTQMISQVLPGMDNGPQTGPVMAGVFQGAGGWRLDFIDGGVLVNCSYLSPNQESYKLGFEDTRTIVTINTRPRPLVLTLHPDQTTITGPGPVTLDGVVASGTGGGQSTPGHTETNVVTNTQQISAAEAAMHAGDSNVQHVEGGYQMTTTSTQSTYVPGTTTPTYSTFSPRRVTCPALNLSSKGAGVGIQTMQTDLLKSMLGGDKGPPTPPGVRMHGIYAAPSTGFSLEFFPESVIVGCGPDAAKAYPYTVTAAGGRASIQIAAPDHPLSLAMRPDGSLDPGATGPYQVHGRVVTGQGANDDFTFAPLEQTCNLATLAPSKTIPANGGTAATLVASSAGPNPGTLSVPGTTLGNATLAVVSGLPGTPNPLAGHPYTLLRDSLPNIVAHAGIGIPTGSSAYKVLGLACAGRTPDCQKILDAVKASAASAVRSDANGAASFPGVQPGTYYLMISTQYNNQPLAWDRPIQLKPGPNSITLDVSNATPLH